MMYIITGTDITTGNLELRAEHRPQHLQRLEELDQQGRLLAAGPVLKKDLAEMQQAGISGSTIIAKFNSLAEAELWANADPYAIHGIFSSVTVQPFKQVFPK